MRVDADEVVLFFSEPVVGTQEVRSAQVVLSAGGIRMIPVLGRTLPPAELDLVAEFAGLRLRERWAGWEREPFSVQSRRHVSIYERLGSG
jgi:hypothetical protein